MKKKVKLIRLIDLKEKVMSSKNESSIESGEIVSIDGYRYLTKVIN